MARIVKEYDQRHQELLKTAQLLFYKKGYTQTSIQDIIDSIGIAKGTFYHYFDSKLDLLEVLVEQSIAEIMVLFEAIVHDDSLDALTKMTRIFELSSIWKTERKDDLLVFVKALYRDENILVRHKIQERSNLTVTPALAKIIKQGVEEGVFDIDFTEDTAEIFLHLSQGISEGLAPILLNYEDYEDPTALVIRKKAAYEGAIERVLGAPKGSLPLFDEAILEVWFGENV